MKIYNEIAINMNPESPDFERVMYEDSYEYIGDMMLCSFKDRDFATVDEVLEYAKTPEGMAFGVVQIIAAIRRVKEKEMNLAFSAQTEAQDVGLTAQPSEASVSNVGTIRPSGVVNWSAVPGGFQPLPQTVGGNKKLYQLSQFHGGLNLKSSPRDISDQECQKSANITFSDIGRIKLLGDCLNEDNALKEFAALDGYASIPGYGLFEFAAPSSLEFTFASCVTSNTSTTVTHSDSSGKMKVGMFVSGSGIPVGATITAVAADNEDFTLSAAATASATVTLTFSDPNPYTILLTADGDQVDALQLIDPDVVATASITDSQVTWIDMGGTDSETIVQIYYAAGNGVYVADASFTNSPRAKVYVYREDINGNEVVRGWVEGAPLLTAPNFHASNANCVSLDNRADDSFDVAAADGAMKIGIHNTVTGGGTWNAGQDATAFYFYVSWLFDGGCETNMASIGTCPDVNDERILFNASIKHKDAFPLGGDKRIEGARVYFKKTGTSERHLLAEISTRDGVRGALDTTFQPWDEPSTDVYNLEHHIIFEHPPIGHSYFSLNQYYANEVYNVQGDDSGSARSAPLSLKYKTVAVGPNGIVYVGNIKFDGKHMPDSMVYSMPGKPAVFPLLNIYDSPSSDGSPITALASFGNTILQFKKNSLYIIDIANPDQFFAREVYRDCGVMNPCQVFTTSFGVIFVNKFGCFVYDGGKVTSLSGGKLDWIKQSGITEEASNSSDANLPCIGYDPRSRSIIILRNIGDNADNTASTNAGGLVYNITTQSWTLANTIIGNGDGTRHSNFIITSEGYLSIKKSSDRTLLNYNHDKTVDTGAQSIIYWTKDFDFGFPAQTKKIMKVYLTYKGDADSLVVKYGVNGESHDSDVTYTFHDLSSDGSSSGASDGSGTPLLDKSSTENLEEWHKAELVPTTSSEATGIYSISLFFEGSVSSDFEINDIAILYRIRPVK